jgi:hypothetical protein
MRFFMLFEGLPVSNDDDVVIAFTVWIEGTLLGNESGIFENLPAEKAAAFIAIGVLDDVTHFADGHFNIFAVDAGFQFYHVVQHDGAEWDGDWVKHRGLLRVLRARTRIIGDAARQANISLVLIDFSIARA